MGGGIGVETGVGFYLFCVLCFHVFSCVLCVYVCVCLAPQGVWVFCAKNIPGILLDIFVDIFCIHFFT